MRTCPCHGTGPLVADPDDPHVDHTAWCQVWTGIALDWLVLDLALPSPLPAYGTPLVPVVVGYVAPDGSWQQVIAPALPVRDRLLTQLMADESVPFVAWWRSLDQEGVVLKDLPVL